MVWCLLWATCAMKFMCQCIVSCLTSSNAVTKSICEFILSMIFFRVAISNNSTLSRVGVESTHLFISLWAMAQTEGPKSHFW